MTAPALCFTANRLAIRVRRTRSGIQSLFALCESEVIARKSINPKTKKIWGSSFPIITVQDWVTSQNELITYRGIDKLAGVLGGSLGGMQALQWSIQYPEKLANSIIIAAAPNLTAQNIAFNEVARQSILTG